MVAFVSIIPTGTSYQTIHVRAMPMAFPLAIQTTTRFSGTIVLPMDGAASTYTIRATILLRIIAATTITSACASYRQLESSSDTMS
jgi:hypothetical protein